MTRSRLVVLVSASLVSIGAVAAVGAFYLDPARSGVGPLPGEALALPAETRAVFGFDVRRLTASPRYRQYADRLNAARPEALRELQEKTGLDPERDVDQVVATAGGGRDEGGVVLCRGRFDRSRIARVIEKQKPAVTWKTHEGVQVYLYREGSRGAAALAFLDDDTLALGPARALEVLITNRVQGKTPLRSNQTLMTLLAGVKPATFWMVGDQSVLSSLPGPGAPGAVPFGLTLPSLQSMVVTAELDPVVALELTAAATDETAAKSLADMVRGLVAMASLQAAQRPELKELASAVSVTTEANRVHVNARFPYELLDSLQPKKTAGSQ